LKGAYCLHHQGIEDLITLIFNHISVPAISKELIILSISFSIMLYNSL
jgi:hypothetical protein